VLDWWMLGQGRLAVITAASTFSQTALDYGGGPRFVVGGLTQCVNASAPYYEEKIYKTPMEFYDQEAKIVYSPYL